MNSSHIFLAYCFQNEIYPTFHEQLAHELKQRGFSVWAEDLTMQNMDEQQWSTILQRLKDSAVLLTVITPKASTSILMDAAINFAQKHRIDIFAILLEGKADSLIWKEIPKERIEKVLDGDLPTPAFFELLIGRAPRYQTSDTTNRNDLLAPPKRQRLPQPIDEPPATSQEIYSSQPKGCLNSTIGQGLAALGVICALLFICALMSKIRDLQLLFFPDGLTTRSTKISTTQPYSTQTIDPGILTLDADNFSRTLTAISLNELENQQTLTLTPTKTPTRLTQSHSTQTIDPGITLSADADKFSRTLTAISLNELETQQAFALAPTKTPTLAPTNTLTMTSTVTSTSTVEPTVTLTLPSPTPEPANGFASCDASISIDNTTVYNAPSTSALPLITLAKGTGVQLLLQPQTLALIPIQFFDATSTPQIGWVEQSALKLCDDLSALWQPTDWLAASQHMPPPRLKVNDIFSVPDDTTWIQWIEMTRTTSPFGDQVIPPTLLQGRLRLQAPVSSAYQIGESQPHQVVYARIGSFPVTHYAWQGVFTALNYTLDARVGIRIVLEGADNEPSLYYEVLSGLMFPGGQCVVMYREYREGRQTESLQVVPGGLSCTTGQYEALLIRTTDTGVRAELNGRRLDIPISPDLVGRPGLMNLVIENVDVRFESILIAGE